jgi:ABC-2 type transport system permease protein
MSDLMNALAVAGKDLKILFKDKGNLAVLFALPILFSLIVAGPHRFQSDTEETAPGEEPALQIKAFLVNEDSGPYGSQVVDGLGGVATLEIESLDSAEEADRRVADGERVAAIVIPAEFSASIDAYEQTEIQVLVDPTQTEAANIAAGIADSVAAEIAMLGEIQYGIRTVLAQSGALVDLDPEAQAAVHMQTLGVIWTQAQEIRHNPVIAVKSTDLEGEEQAGGWDPFAHSTAGFTVMFNFFLVGIIAESLLKEKESGAFRRLLSSPMRRGSIIGGKILGYMVIVFLQVLVMFTFGNLMYDMSLGNSVAGMLGLTIALALAASSMGLMIGSLFETSKKASNVGLILGFVLMIIGGCIYPTYSVEGFMGLLSRLTPHAHAVMGYVKLMTEGIGLIGVLPNVGVLVGMAAVFFGVAVWRFRFE